MATPRVFVSSTCYDLKYIRENLKYFIRTIGFEPVLSDEGQVFYNPTQHTHDSCLAEVPNCQLFVLIVGGRHGGDFKDTDKSITNHEYREAIKHRVPVFALVEQAVYSDHHVYITNRRNDQLDGDKIIYPSVDDVRIFGFIDEVRKGVLNNAIYPFRDFSDIERYLKQQWSGMMYDFLVKDKFQKELATTNSLLDNLALATAKTEELVKSLYLHLEPQKAHEAIEDIDRTAAGKKFFEALLKKFRIPGLVGVDVDSLMRISLDQPWYDFVASTKKFHFEEFADGDGKMVGVLFENNGDGYEIFSEGTPNEIYHEFEEMFNDFKKLDQRQRREVFASIVKQPVSAPAGSEITTNGASREAKPRRGR